MPSTKNQKGINAHASKKHSENYQIREFLSTFVADKQKPPILMKIVFKDEASSDLYVNGKTEDRKYKKLHRNNKLVEGYQRAVSIMYNVNSTEELKLFSFLHYEKLKYRKEPLSSIRLVNGMVERLLFTETEDGIEVELLEIDNTHYGNKK